MMNPYELYGKKREKEGLIKGIKEGLEKGREDRSNEIYKKALKMGFDEKTAYDLAFGD